MKQTRFISCWIAWLAFGSALLFSVQVGAQTWYESYHQAEEALEGERWSEAIRHLNEALEVNPNSGMRVRTYGMRFIDYFPYLKLGIAYQELGQSEAALQAFETEMRQGQVEQSSERFAELKTYRSRVEEELQSEEVRKKNRIQELVSQGLAEAQHFEEQRSIEKALSALAKVLAVDPDHSEAIETQRRLLLVLTENEKRENEERRYSQLLKKGQAALEARDYGSAAASLSEAQALRSDRAVEALLNKAQEGLRAEIPANRNRATLVTQGLERVYAKEKAGELVEALTELQKVLAVEPEHREGRALLSRLLKAQAATEEEDLQADSIANLLTEAGESLANGDPARAVSLANRVLALDPDNGKAPQMVAQAYGRLSARMLAEESAPPALVLDGFPTDSLTRVVRSPRVEVTGTAFASSPVALNFLLNGEPSLGGTTIESREVQGLWITSFRWESDVPGGSSTLEVIAAEEGAEPVSVVSVLDYQVPFRRTLWFPLLMILALGLLVLGGKLLKVRKKRQLLRGRFNPYVAGAPILAQKNFFGRQNLLDYVLRRIHNNSILLYGERRIGKTSLQHRLKDCLANLNDPVCEFYPVFIDLQGTSQERFFATLGEEIFHELDPLLNGLKPVKSFDEDYQYRSFVKDLHGIVKALKTVSSKKPKLVLLIDEVDELNTYNPRINQKLRSLFMRALADHLVSVFSGVEIKKQWEREGSPWYNFFQEVEVEPLDPKEARALVESPVEGIFTFEEGVADQIIRHSNHKPYLIQKICSRLVDRMHEQKRSVVTQADLNLLLEGEGL